MELYQEQEQNIVECELVAIKKGKYTLYVFKIANVIEEYIMCTRLPNWQTLDFSIGIKGFLQYQIVLSGQTYFDAETGMPIKYQHSNVYFNNFIVTNNK